MKNVFVFDLDGVLADSDPERIALIQPDGSCDWTKYYACDFRKDGYNERAWFLLRTVFGSSSQIVLLTSRSESARDQTVEWVTRKLGTPWMSPLGLLMREEGDERPAHIIKPEYLKRARITPEEVAFVIDDEIRNVKALQEAGYFALHYQRGTGADESTARTEGTR